MCMPFEFLVKYYTKKLVFHDCRTIVWCICSSFSLLVEWLGSLGVFSLCIWSVPLCQFFDGEVALWVLDHARVLSFLSIISLTLLWWSPGSFLVLVAGCRLWMRLHLRCFLVKDVEYVQCYRIVIPDSGIPGWGLLRGSGFRCVSIEGDAGFLFETFCCNQSVYWMGMPHNLMSWVSLFRITLGRHFLCQGIGHLQPLPSSRCLLWICDIVERVRGGLWSASNVAVVVN